jgi:hypothetical protein
VGGSPHELTTPYLTSQLFELDFAQKNDVIIITHPLHEPRCLKRVSNTSWSIAPIPWAARPWNDENTTTTSLTLSKPASQILGTFSAGVLTSDWVGSFLRVYRGIDDTIHQTSFREVMYPASYGGSTVAENYQTFNPALTYVVTPSAAQPTLTNHVQHGEPDTPFDSLWTCTQAWTAGGPAVAGLTSPADYPTYWSRGWIAIDGLKVAGTWEFETKGVWKGIWKIERSYNNGTSWETVGTVISDADHNALITDSESEDKPAIFRVIAYSTDSNYKAQIFFRIVDGKIAQELEITGVNAAGTVADLTAVTPEYDLEFNVASTEWSDSAFSVLNGYPRSTTFHESRLFFAGTTNQPERLWGSKTEAFFNFRAGTKADDSFSFVLNANRYNAIVWLASQQSLLIGTTGAEWSSFTTEGGPMTPENTNFHLHTHHGSDAHQGLVLSDAAVFVQRQGRKIREFAPSAQGLGIYASPDLSELAEHVTRGGIKQLARRDSPDTELFALRNDGVLATMIFERSQSLYAWQRWTTAGVITSVATTYGDAEDDAVFIAVERVIEGVTSTFIEFLAADGIRTEENQTAADFVSLDHAISTLPLPVSYAGATVSAQAGFEDLGDFLVAADGSVPIPAGKTNVKVGFNYISETEPLPVEVGGNANKTIHNSAHTRVRNSANFKVGTSKRDQWNLIRIEGVDGAPVSTDTVITIPGRNARNSSVVIRKDRPGPLSLISIDLETQTGNL